VIFEDFYGNSAVFRFKVTIPIMKRELSILDFSNTKFLPLNFVNFSETFFVDFGSTASEFLNFLAILAVLAILAILAIRGLFPLTPRFDPELSALHPKQNLQIQEVLNSTTNLKFPNTLDR